jgi:hypothetical protein
MTMAAQNICYSVAYGENADTKIAAQIGGYLKSSTDNAW